MHRNLSKVIVQLSVVALSFISAGIASAQTVKVACIGDSITALPSSWCGTLSTKLGSGYMVSNFGVSGTNLAKGVAQPYWNTSQYTSSHTFAPNIVIIMLGTNDAFTRSWGSAKGHFVADYEALLDTYTTLASKPKPYMIIPTPIGTSPFGHSGDLLATEVIPMIKQVAMTKMVPTIDAFTLFGGAMFNTMLFSATDQVHPNAQGQRLLGEEVYKVLMETGALGGSGAAGSGATAGTGASAGSSGMAAAGTAGGSAMAGAGGMAAAGTAGGSANAGGGAIAGGGAGTMSTSGAAGGGATPGPRGNAGSIATTAGSTSPAGAGGSAVAGSGTITNPLGAAGAMAPMAPAPESDDGGCRATGSSTTNNAATALFLLLLGTVIRSRRRSRSSVCQRLHRNRHEL